MSTSRPACPVRGAATSPPTGGAAAAAYAVVVYVAFLAVFTYFIGWVEGLSPRTIDAGRVSSSSVALVVDVIVLGVFAVQHSAMARPAFKQRWTHVVPAPLERSTYVLFSSAAIAFLMSQWRPLPELVWDVEPGAVRAALYVVSFTGWGLVLLSTFLIDHFDLFGLRPVLRHVTGKAPVGPAFVTPLLYRIVRHPLYLGFLLAFWAAPSMTRGRLLFAGVMTVYVLVAIRLEERDLDDTFGDTYRTYRERTSMLIPLRRRTPAELWDDGLPTGDPTESSP